MNDNENKDKNNKYSDSTGKEMLGVIVFFVIMIAIMIVIAHFRS